MVRVIAALLVLACASFNESTVCARDVDLHAAIFVYLPDASTAIERLEEDFEKQFASIDLDLELWNPYDDAFTDDGMIQIVDFDVVEIDACRIDELMAGKFGGLDAIPSEASQNAASFVGPAKTLMGTDASRFLVPHWVCGNYVQIWACNDEVVEAEGFDEFLKTLDAAGGKPALASMWGKTELGEYYADAYLDVHGPEKTREHLIELYAGKTDLDENAKKAVIAIVRELTPDNQANLSHFSNHSYYFPRCFAANKQATLIGYSERLYYSERELILTPKAEHPTIKPDDVVIRQMAFGEKSQGTPSWVDGFVIPKGKLEKKHAAIAAFLQFMLTNETYLTLAEPAPSGAPAYLLPATDAAYDEESELVKKQPVLAKFRAAMSEEFPVMNSQVWQGMRTAGAKLREEIKPKE